MFPPQASFGYTSRDWTKTGAVDAGFVLVDLALDLFDQRQNVAHAEYSLRYAVGIERLDRVVFFTDTDKFYRLTDNLFN